METKETSLENLERHHPGALPEEPKKAVKRTHASAFFEDTALEYTAHDFVSEWLDSVGPERPRKRRNSDGGFSSTLANNSTDNKTHVPRKSAESLPDMSNIRNRQGFAVPSLPSSFSRQSRSRQPNSTVDGSSVRDASPSSNSGPRNRKYRDNNLTLNGIYFHELEDSLPDDLAQHVESTRAKRGSPGPSDEHARAMRSELYVLDGGCDEGDVEKMMHDYILPHKNEPGYDRAVGLASASSAPMTQSLVPNNSDVPFKVTQPKPDKLYGYSGIANKPFTEPQLLGQVKTFGQTPQVNLSGLRFPFLCIEVKAAGGTRGDLWVAANQAAGASAACLDAMDRLRVVLSEQGGAASEVVQLDRFTYAVTIDNNTAKLYISWKEDAHYYLRMVDSYSLFRPDDFRAFRGQVRNILDWGKDKRLKQIQRALDTIMVEGAKRASALAKARPTPPSDSDSSSAKRVAR